MNKKAIESWLKLTDRTKRNKFEETAAAIGLPNAAAVEKDWWVVRTLELVYKSSIAEHTVFKGGTSLSKAWGLIDCQIKIPEGRCNGCSSQIFLW